MPSPDTRRLRPGPGLARGACVYSRVQAVRCSGRGSIGGRGAGRSAALRVAGGGAGLARALPPVRLGAASARSSPVPALRRAVVKSRAHGGGGSPSAARPCVDAAARSRSASRLAPTAERRSRRARSHAAQPPPYPKLRPVFLWANQLDGAVQYVDCEDYPPFNTLWVKNSQSGWFAYPRTASFDAIRRRRLLLGPRPLFPPSPPPARRSRRRRRSPRASPSASELGPAWLEPDLESHIPLHKISVSRVPPRPPSEPSSPVPSEPPSPAPDASSALIPPPTKTAQPPQLQLPEPTRTTPLDSLLAVAEFAFHQQNGTTETMDMSGPRFAFLPPEEAPSELFALDGDGKAEDVEDAFRDELFESISEAHYLLPPALESHEDALLESLVEKGCEDNQILDRLSLVTGADYEESLLSDAPVADVIDRLQSLESPSRSAAQGLLHLRHLPTRRPSVVDPFVPDEVFAPEPSQSSNDDRRLRRDEGHAEVMYTEQIPDLPHNFDYEVYDIASIAEVRSNVPAALSEEAPGTATKTPEAVVPKSEFDENDLRNIRLDILASEIEGMDFKLEESVLQRLKKEIPTEVEQPTGLSAVPEIDAEEAPTLATEIPTALESVFIEATENEPSDKSDDLPKDLSMHRRISGLYASPRLIDIPRAPSSCESDAMQSPQPSGIPANSSPEVFNTSTNKTCTPAEFFDALYRSTSPKMFNSEVTIQQCVPLNLGKHNTNSASPTVSSCSDEIRNANKNTGEPHEKRSKRESRDLGKRYSQINKCGESNPAEATQKKKLSEIEQLPPLKQLELLKSNKNFNLPECILVPRDRLNNILAAPGKEITALLMERPQLNMAEILQDPNFNGDSELMVISLEQLKQLIIYNDHSQTKPPTERSRRPSEAENARDSSIWPDRQQQAESNPHSRPIPSMGHLADDIEAASSAAAYQMNYQFYHMSNLEAVAARAEILKTLGSAGYAGPSYTAGVSPMYHLARYAGVPTSSHAPLTPEGRLQLAMWQEAIALAQRQNHADAAKAAQDAAAAKLASMYAHFNKRATSPAALAAAAYRSPPPGALLPPMTFYPPRSSPPHFVNNNYLQAARQEKARGAGSPRPRISVKSLQELQHSAMAASAPASAGARRAAPALGPRRRDEQEVVSTTSPVELGLLPPHLTMPQHPHEPAEFPLWHPLFSK